MRLGMIRRTIAGKESGLRTCISPDGGMIQPEIENRVEAQEKALNAG
jgi:hypothetical protein